MRSVQIKTNDLLAILRDNRDKHVKDYNEAVIGYREEAILELKDMLAKAEQPSGEIIRQINAVQPTSYKESYDTVIRMLELSADDTVELTMQEFQQYVEDKWTWKNHFEATSTYYAAKKFG